MNDAPEPEREPSAAPYLRLPMPVVAIGLSVFLAVLLAVGIYANRNLRPQGIVVPTPVLQPAPSETPLPVAAAPRVTFTSVPLVATSLPTPLILVVASPTTPPLVQTLSPTGTPEPTASESTTPLPTVEPELAAEVGKAYENFWRVRSQAGLTLDVAQLSDVMDGDYLAHFVDAFRELKSEGRAIQTKVVLNYTVVQALGDLAFVHDRIEDSSYYVDVGSHTALTDPANEVLLIEFKLMNIDGKWKVVDSVRKE